MLAASAALIVAFVVIELRSKAPLLPMRIFRLRTLPAANVTGFLVGAALFSQFFLLTLYMQQVLHYSAIETGVAYITLTLAIIVFAGIAQGIVTRVGVRWPMTFGLGAVGGRARPLHAAAGRRHYFWDIFPGFLLSGIGLAFAFVPMTIAALIGVRRGRRRHRVRADQHEPADRRRGRPRRGDDDRDDVHGPLCRLARGRHRGQPRGAELRLRDHLLRPGRAGRARSRPGRRPRRAGEKTERAPELAFDEA